MYIFIYYINKQKEYELHYSFLFIFFYKNIQNHRFIFDKFF